ncbi:glycoside hydrolase 15-related protein [Rhodomicrobium vannielii ATCC 17100]|uniref:Trehalase n=1 Tax=Rhodomicrobium vannielii (strain ATCC 17100 / DSM 162 / LMG 4299 / NCIMB 10020 / ATH 3.1.1) TaxID=648757 RepID=E3I4G4_RHOVT|nr:glycoside hydrolase family 15 protein [Rhodomicrobium vannielii]ADP70479.1 glycoside hydrolase 15-related protein [Rhodomicrobium vannielii ATCC 17100]
MTKRIEDYALLGDCESAALIGFDGTIEWLCWPRFDSGAVFASLLGDDDNGCWRLAAKDEKSRRRAYREGTLILDTVIETATGSALVIDFMPLGPGNTRRLVRIVEGLTGEVDMETGFRLRFDYGLIVPWITRVDGDGFEAIAGPDKAVLTSGAPIAAEGGRLFGSFTVKAGDKVPFVLAHGASYQPVPPAIDPFKALDQTETAWREWTGQCIYDGPHAEIVRRSLIALKGLTYQPTGAIVAAPTTSLPEAIGGERNWDYRFCWLRDATFTLLALMNTGFRFEAEEWRTWLMRAVAGSAQQVQIVYGIAGERHLVESTIPWLPGFRNSRPVRIGNAAAGQLQLDIFGEVMDALYQSSKCGLEPTGEAWHLQRNLVEYLERIWRLPDEGLWEVRGGARHFVHSKVMAWVAFDRAVKSVERFGVEGPVERWRVARDEIHAQVCAEGYDGTVGAFVQSYGSTALDASALLIPIVGFLPPCDPRVQSTVRAIGDHLRSGRLIRRYDTKRTDDGLDGGEGAFLACSFWYADNFVLQGRLAEAEDYFDYLVTLGNDVGLFAEEYDEARGRMLGNFPQAFSHVALVNTACNLAAARKPFEERAGATLRDAP